MPNLQRKRYLIDRRTGTVYEPIGRDTAWPRPMGTFDRNKRILNLKPAAASSADLFTALDLYLRKERVRFSDLFRHYDRNGGYSCSTTVCFPVCSRHVAQERPGLV